MNTTTTGWLKINGKFHYGEITAQAQFYSACGHYREHVSVQDVVAEEQQCDDCKAHAKCNAR